MYAQPSRIVAEREWTMRAAGPSLDSLLVRPELTLWRQTSNLKQVRGLLLPWCVRLLPPLHLSYPATAHHLMGSAPLRTRRSAPAKAATCATVAASGHSSRLTGSGAYLHSTAVSCAASATRPHQDSSTALCARVCIVHMPERAMSCKRLSLRALCAKAVDTR